MNKVLLAAFLGTCILSVLTGCGKQSTKLAMDSDTIVSISISGYPIIFSNGDSIDSTTDVDKIADITAAFNKVTFTYYKTKEEWDKIGSASNGKEQASIAFYNAKKECVERLSRVSNADGSFIMKRIGEEVFIASEEDYNKLNNIFDSLINEAKDGRLSD